VIPSLGGAERLVAKGGTSPAWSPDGKFIAYSTGYAGNRELFGLFIVPATAGAPRKVETELADYCCPLWSPDGKRLLVSTDTGLSVDWFVVPVEGGKAVRVSVQTPLRRAGVTDIAPPVAWLGNRDLLIFSAAQGGEGGLRQIGSGVGGRQGAHNIWQVSIE